MLFIQSVFHHHDTLAILNCIKHALTLKYSVELQSKLLCLPSSFNIHACFKLTYFNHYPFINIVFYMAFNSKNCLLYSRPSRFMGSAIHVHCKSKFLMIQNHSGSLWAQFRSLTPVVYIFLLKSILSLIFLTH